MTYVAAAISSFHETSTVMIAAGICAGTCLVITLFSMWTKVRHAQDTHNHAADYD